MQFLQTDEDMNAKPAPFGTRDSCGKHPFFGSYENSAHPDRSNGSISDGIECAQLTALRAPNPVNDLAADWKEVAELGSPTGSELCVRARIPAKLNLSVGGPPGTLVQTTAWWAKILQGYGRRIITSSKHVRKKELR